MLRRSTRRTPGTRSLQLLTHEAAQGTFMLAIGEATVCCRRAVSSGELDRRSTIAGHPGAPGFRLLQAQPAVSGQRRSDIAIGELKVKPFGIEVTTSPASGVCVFRVTAIGHDREEVCVPARPTDVL